MGLAVLAEVTAIGVHHKRGVVVDAGLFLLEDGHDQYQVELAGQASHQLGGGPPGTCSAREKYCGILDLAEVRARRRAPGNKHLGALRGRLGPGSTLASIIDSLSPVQRLWTRAARTISVMTLPCQGSVLAAVAGGAAPSVFDGLEGVPEHANASSACCWLPTRAVQYAARSHKDRPGQ